MTPVLCPGSFDPITVGHIDIIRRARELFGNVLVGVGRLETVLLPAAAEHVTLSSTILREVMKLGGNVDRYVPDNVARAIRERRQPPHH